MWRFQSRLVREAGFMPLFKDGYRGERFGRFVAQIINDTTSPAQKPEHGARHGRVERAPETSDLLLACVIEHTRAAGGQWTGRTGALYEAVTARAQTRGPLPLDWSPSPTALGFALKRIDHDGFLAAGVEWRRHRTNGTHRVPLTTFRLTTEGNSSQAA
jgi:hypothetical protein